MKIYAQVFKTYEGARKRMLLEKATNRGDYVWGVKHLGVREFHVTRQSRKEFERELAIASAVAAFGFDSPEQSP